MYHPFSWISSKDIKINKTLCVVKLEARREEVEVHLLLQNFNEEHYALRQHCFVLKICNTKRKNHKILQSCGCG